MKGNRTSLVKQKPPAIVFVQILGLWLCVFDPAASGSTKQRKPNKAFWPRDVRISEEVKVEPKKIWTGDLETDSWFCRKGG